MPRSRASGLSAGSCRAGFMPRSPLLNATPADWHASALFHERHCTARDRRAHVRRLKLKRK
ncbi:hypothetical protein [Burkholderia pseudomallei]|uniref:hypothetical protein n=1 Tax=Burkholderia pseudomallei TaxID=28450 RepID=UPI0009B212C8|nr:hypothetical protein [Burkholderia pseudomallei]